MGSPNQIRREMWHFMKIGMNHLRKDDTVDAKFSLSQPKN
jgi:hypothetical protein